VAVFVPFPDLAVERFNPDCWVALADANPNGCVLLITPKADDEVVLLVPNPDG
jgi:hypothetical protein